MRTLLVIFAVCFSACGPTVGDPCTTAGDCIGRACINSKLAPGGYCSMSCTLSDLNSCPTGTICVAEVLGHNLAGCMRVCSTNTQCREGYICNNKQGSKEKVCIAPDA